MYESVIFDLYGTLVPNFTQEAYEPVYRATAEILDVGYESYRSAFGHAYRDRCKGRWKTLEECVRYAAEIVGAEPSEVQVQDAVAVRMDFTKKSLQASDSTLDTLSRLNEYGIRIGLLTNCGPDVPLLWGESNLHAHIYGPTFSSDIGFVKPEAQAYVAAADAVGSRLTECLFCGDGSSREIDGANEAGMRGILLRVSVNDVYDTEGRNSADDLLEHIEHLEEIVPIATQQGGELDVASRHQLP